MLILSRKVDESIIINNKIKVKVLEIEGNKVQLGIEAPDNIAIHREEIFAEIQKENKEAIYSENKHIPNLRKILKNGQKDEK